MADKRPSDWTFADAKAPSPTLTDEQVKGRLAFLQRRLEEVRDGTVTQKWFIEARGLLRIIQSEREARKQ